jgi:serine phosphatase RsbU (regulator of sigma subunit)
MLGAPLMSGGSTIGVLHVGTLGDRVFDDHDAQLLQVAADRIAAAVRLRLLESERAAAEALQRSLLPSVPSHLDELEFAARYVPTEHGGIGGDWYDVFRAPDGAIWVVTGDVAGHGLRAAVVMGRVRSALRSYALVNTEPDQVLAMTDRKVEHFEVGHMATVVVAVFRPPFDEMIVAAAGHPRPIVAASSGVAAFVELDPGPPLGAAAGRGAWTATATPFPSGAVAVFYTDGLVERRGEHLDIGMERLRNAVHVSPPSLLCRDVMAEVIGDREPTDDIALLVVRRG